MTKEVFLENLFVVILVNFYINDFLVRSKTSHWSDESHVDFWLHIDSNDATLECVIMVTNSTRPSWLPVECGENSHLFAKFPGVIYINNV